MHRTHLDRAALVLVSLVTLAACGSGGQDETQATSAVDVPAAPAETVSETTDAMAESADTSTVSETATAPVDSAGNTETTDAMETVDTSALAAWQTLPITDVDGVTFTFADLVGTPVIVENFATWCPNCRKQLEETNVAAAELGDDAAVVALSVETDLSPSDVADYAADNGFDNVRFAVMSPELLAAMVDAFGNTAANPPSTPKVLVDAMGTPGELTTGPESAEDLVAAVRASAG